jgi:hypothetical protein
MMDEKKRIGKRAKNEFSLHLLGMEPPSLPHLTPPISNLTPPISKFTLHST